MVKRCFTILSIFVVLFALAACTNKKVNNPIAQVDSKQPDKVLFDRAMEAMKHNKYDVARLTLQTLINTYPDSEYVARAKLAVGDSWYAEGGSAAMTQAENEYKDFITFFPNMPEAAEAQLKIANIHYREMEKPDRDFTHAMRAEEEYRNLINQFPDSKLVPEAKQRLLQVQEVLAEREYRIGRFYYMRESYNAAIARLKSVVDTYPLYSKADDALFLLGSSYMKQADAVRASKGLTETIKAKIVKQREDMAAQAFDKIVTQYAATNRVDDAKKMLAAMHRPVPQPTPQELAQSKAIEESRGEPGMSDRFLSNLHRGPDQQLKVAAKAGDPVLVDPPQTSAPKLMQDINDEMKQAVAESLAPASGGGHKVSVETVGTGAPPPNEAPPRSDAGSSTPAANDPNAIPELTPIADPSKQPDAQPATPPKQINEVDSGGAPSADSGGVSSSTSSSSTASSSSGDGTASASNGQGKDAQKDQADYSTSKKKKKKGLGKLNPF